MRLRGGTSGLAGLSTYFPPETVQTNPADSVTGCAAHIDRARLPLSDPALLATLITGGDDYELAFTAPPEARRLEPFRRIAGGVAIVVWRTCRIGFLGRQKIVPGIPIDGAHQ